jgi:hypothetical protein
MHVGPHSVAFSGDYTPEVRGGAPIKRPGPVPLQPGRYDAVLTAENTTGTSRPIKLDFVVER